MPILLCHNYCDRGFCIADGIAYQVVQHLPQQFLIPQDSQSFVYDRSSENNALLQSQPMKAV